MWFATWAYPALDSSIRIASVFISDENIIYIWEFIEMYSARDGDFQLVGRQTVGVSGESCG